MSQQQHYRASPVSGGRGGGNGSRRPNSGGGRAIAPGPSGLTPPPPLGSFPDAGLKLGAYNRGGLGEQPHHDYGLQYTAGLPAFEGRISSSPCGGPAADYMAALCVAAVAGEHSA